MVEAKKAGEITNKEYIDFWSDIKKAVGKLYGNYTPEGHVPFDKFGYYFP